MPFDLGGGRKLKTMAGSGGVVVFDDSTDVVALCARIMEFYAHESCGQCTPCREGSGWLARVCRRLANGEGAGGRRRAAGQHRQRHRRQHDLRAGRRGGLADAGLPDQVPRRLRGQAPPSQRRAAGRQEGGRVNAVLRDGTASASSSSSGCWPRSSLLRALHDHPQEPGHRGHVAGGDVLRPGGDLRDAVGALPGGPAGAGLRRRDHGALHLRRHDPEPRRGGAGVVAAAAGPGRPGRRLPVREVRRRRRRRPPRPRSPATVAESFGTVGGIGDLLFRDFLYPFEAISLLLLVAVVGGVVISRSHQKEVAAKGAADYRKQVHELASRDYPGAHRAARRRHGGHAAGGHH